MSHNKTIISILISLIIICLVCGGCSEKVQTLEKNRIYILDGENMSDDMLGELSEYGCEEYKALKYKDDFPVEIILKLPCGDIAVKKCRTKAIRKPYQNWDDAITPRKTEIYIALIGMADLHILNV